MPGQTLPFLAVLKISAILLKYSTFDSVFYVFMGRTSAKLEFLRIEKKTNFCLFCQDRHN